MVRDTRTKSSWHQRSSACSHSVPYFTTLQPATPLQDIQMSYGSCAFVRDAFHLGPNEARSLGAREDEVILSCFFPRWGGVMKLQRAFTTHSGTPSLLSM